MLNEDILGLTIIREFICNFMMTHIKKFPFDKNFNWVFFCMSFGFWENDFCLKKRFNNKLINNLLHSYWLNIYECQNDVSLFDLMYWTPSVFQISVGLKMSVHFLKDK